MISKKMSARISEKISIVVLVYLFGNQLVDNMHSDFEDIWIDVCSFLKASDRNLSGLWTYRI